MKRTSLARKTRLKRKPWRRALGTPEQRGDFKRKVLELDGDCVMIGRSFCEGELQAAHVVPKQRLRRLGYGAEVVYSPAAAMTLCERHHNRHDRFLERVPYGYIPARCKLFLDALNLSDLLRETAA